MSRVLVHSAPTQFQSVKMTVCLPCGKPIFPGEEIFGMGDSLGFVHAECCFRIFREGHPVVQSRKWLVEVDDPVGKFKPVPSAKQTVIPELIKHVAVILNPAESSKRINGDWSCFVSSTESEAVGKAITVKQDWEASSLNRYIILKGTLTEVVHT